MGSWGTGLYQNDTASDLKMVFSDFSRRPTDTDTLVSQVLEKFDVSKYPLDGDAADIFLALADLLHQYDLDHPATMRHARQFIESGRDLEIKRSLGMSPRDLAKREKALAEALERWSRPHPKPKKRKAPKEPEPVLLDVGDVWVFPTMRHAVRPFHVRNVDLSGFDPDGWGAFAVAERFHFEGHRACYLCVLALPGTVDRPTLDDVMAAPLQQCSLSMQGYGEWTYARDRRRDEWLSFWRVQSVSRTGAAIRPRACLSREHGRDHDGLPR